jgi:hypothetical protein
MKDINSSHAEFADDLTLWPHSESNVSTAQVLQLDLEKIEKWSRKWKVSFSPSKCKFSYFQRNQLPAPEHPTFTFFNSRVEYEQNPRLLGLNLDRSLTWTYHIGTVSS